LLNRLVVAALHSLNSLLFSLFELFVKSIEGSNFYMLYDQLDKVGRHNDIFRWNSVYGFIFNRSLAPKALATSTCAEKTVSTANLTFAKLSCCCCCYWAWYKDNAIYLIQERVRKKYLMACYIFFFGFFLFGCLVVAAALHSLNSLLFSLFKLFVKSVFVVNIETMK
jgi:hypothetical protein